MEPIVLSINPGSSSREFSIYRGNSLVFSAYFEREEDSFVISYLPKKVTEKVSSRSFDQSLGYFLQKLSEATRIKPSQIDTVGIRLVAPGKEFQKTRRVNEQFLEDLEKAASRAPLHVPTEITQIEQTMGLLPDAKIVAVSDSTFHRTMPTVARRYAIPYQDISSGFNRFGYHGISIQSVVRTLKDEKKLDYKNIIVCHLGSGSSITAIKSWKSVETSMGFSPLEGLVMATRSGNIDIEAALEIKRARQLDDSQLVEFLNKQSGLLGVSGVSSDIRELLKVEASNKNAQLALQMMVYRIRFYLGAYFAILGGIDALVFTATVGERSAPIRQRVCENLTHLGIEIDQKVNLKTDTKFKKISTTTSSVDILVVPTDEPKEMAIQAFELVTK
ncbi:acetate/propionate family kinase [Candidatus Saccharibacteria bacterium]|jgi:acetate kinase|nr:acetate/propionate family kinase [Candidatus Saccharibacteria bacterium]